MLRRLSDDPRPPRPTLPDRAPLPVLAVAFLVGFTLAVLTMIGTYAWLLLPEELPLVDKGKVLLVVVVASVLLGVAAVLLGKSAGRSPINYE